MFDIRSRCPTITSPYSSRNSTLPDQLSHSIEPILPNSAKRPVRWSHLFGAALSLAAAQASKQHDGLLVVALANSRQVQIAAEELAFFLGNAQGDEVDNDVHVFPEWETLAYDVFSPHQDIISSRLKLLSALPKMQGSILLTTTESLLQRLPPLDFVLAHSFTLKTKEHINIDKLRLQLQDVGYHNVSQVLEQGEFAIRGGLIDVFPMGASRPFRLDLFDDEIESIRYFDPETQKSTDTTADINLLPAREVPLTESGIRHFRRRFREQFAGDPSKQHIYTEVSEGRTAPGIEFYLPLFFEETATLFDYLPDNSLLLLEGSHQDTVSAISAQIKDRYEARKDDNSRQILPPNLLYLDQSECAQQLSTFKHITHFGSTDKNADWYAPCKPPQDFPVQARTEQPYQAIAAHLHAAKHPVLLAVETAGRREALEGVLLDHDLIAEVQNSWQGFVNQPCSLGIIVGDMARGLHLDTPEIELITESQLYGEKVLQRRQRAQHSSHDPEAIIRSLAELQMGAPVVHIDHGVGRYQGLQVLDMNEHSEEFLVISYHDNDKLFVPIQSLQLISRFVGGDPELAPLHKLGSGVWERAKNKAQQKSYDVAVELLQMQAARQARSGIAFEVPQKDYQLFADRFGFEETHDQQRAIDEVMGDLISTAPMDRLVCGDVGFGKTEVALRAAFVAAANSKQVVMLVPTTLLAQQHFETFQNRFADMPISVGLLSRFSSKKETTDLLEKMKSGQPDIVIGTHRLIQDDIAFHNLGLIIIDEEHRFGVRQKEKLKRLRNEVDILTLTATPIPRTLNMTMSGLREISIIATPPEQRLAIKTFVMDYDETVIREACLREIHRGGQMYFVHNEVKTIQRMAEELTNLLPEAKIAFAHGQMGEMQLEQIMRDFYHQRFNILVATTIIESGIDVPSANTIIINRADKFGLAQLHQLRGRVGRSHHQAFAYLLVPERKYISKDAGKRLTAIEQLDTLGAGFSLASHDLEIRGAGELLGETQSGLIDDVGFNLYTEYLNRAIKAIQKTSDKSGADVIDHTQQAANLDAPLPTEISMGVAALFPDSYLSDIHLRLVMYKRIASAQNAEELKELQIESIDRFGLLPDEGKYLFRCTELKLQAMPLGIQKIDVDDEGGKIEFAQHAAVDPVTIIELVQNQPRVFSLQGPTILRINKDLDEIDLRFSFIEQLVQHLTATEGRV